MLGSSCRNSCLVLISSLPIFARLHLDQWVWTRHWFPPKWWSLSWTHPKVIPAKTAKVGSAQNPGRPSHVMWLTIKRRGLWPKEKKMQQHWIHYSVFSVMEFVLIVGQKYVDFWLKWVSRTIAEADNHTPKIQRPYFHWYFYQNTPICMQ